MKAQKKNNYKGMYLGPEGYGYMEYGYLVSGINSDGTYFDNIKALKFDRPFIRQFNKIAHLMNKNKYLKEHKNE